MPKSEISDQDSVDLDLQMLDLKSIAALEGTALEAIIKDIKDQPQGQPTAAHRSYDKYRTHGTVRW